MTDYQDLWNKVLNKLKSSIDERNYQETFSEATKVAKAENGVIFVVCPSLYIKRKINSTYYRGINEKLQEISGTKNIKVTFVTQEELTPYLKVEEKKPVILNNSNYLNPNYTFDSFVVVDSNRIAYLAALILVDSDNISLNNASSRDIVNPFYIFGGVGLGKTHLMQAIGNYIANKNINNKIVYVSANEFLDDYTKASYEKSMNSFNDKYNNIDYLLIDDIQMLADKQGTQQQFFKIFNEMDNKNKQIVITSDRPANQLNGFMDRLTSRFAKGTTVNINVPDLKQRISILERKVSELSPEELSQDVLVYIAENFVSNIRELEGALNRVLLLAKLYNRKPDLALTKEALEPLMSTKTNKEDNDYEKLLSVISSMYSISLADLISTQRSIKYVYPRHIAMYILRTKYGLTHSKIGYIFNGRDHTTIMNACKKIESDLKTNKELRNMVDSILKKCE